MSHHGQCRCGRERCCTRCVVQVATGAMGATGAQGPQGAVGAQGALGSQGVPGGAGPQGTSGAQGASGARGAQGAAGAAGAAGVQGVQGADGASGPQGVSGAQGLQGASGVQGASGSQGTQGGSGTQGAQGASGSQGASGAAGTQGADGASGPQGAAGAQGASGAQGAQGSAGSPGAPASVPYATGFDALNETESPTLDATNNGSGTISSDYTTIGFGQNTAQLVTNANGITVTSGVAPTSKNFPLTYAWLPVQAATLTALAVTIAGYTATLTATGTPSAVFSVGIFLETTASSNVFSASPLSANFSFGAASTSGTTALVATGAVAVTALQRVLLVAYWSASANTTTQMAIITGISAGLQYTA